MNDEPSDIMRMNGLSPSGFPIGPADGMNYWICPWCGKANFRDTEGLDACENCGSETRVAFKGFDVLMVVLLAREPSNGARIFSAGGSDELAGG